jgi:hypothetical protein
VHTVADDGRSEDFRKAEDHKIEGHELKNDGLVYPYTSNRSVLRKRFEF